MNLEPKPMDPDENLRIQLERAEEINDIFHLEEDGDTNWSEMCLKAMDLAQHVLALNSWILDGGFLPKRWRNQ